VLSLRTDERGKQLLARDTQGKVLFYGFVNTSEQRDRVPEAILPKLERLETPPKPQSPRARAPMAAVPPAD